MPLWSQEFIEPPWSKKHTVTLQTRDRYDELARKGGSDKIERHKPLSLAGGHGRKAGASDMYEESHDDGRVNRDEGREDTWRDDLEDGSKVVSVRDVKNAIPNYKTLQPQHHAFARFVLPVSSTAFSEQDWPGKKTEEKEQQDHKKQSGDQGDNEKKDELSPEIQRFLDLLLQEDETQRSFENNDGKPDGELKLLDQSAVEQLEPTLSVEDQSTPDSWVPRSARLLRLAGVHPVNAEPDVTEMFDAGMITPTKLHYVRSHGPVPQLTWEDHKLTVFSDPPEIISDPKNWTMDELASGKFRIIEIPVTIACDGNRRKEMSMMKQASGVGFSAAGVSTCMWRGVHVRDVLLASGLRDQPDTEHWHLNFEGADDCSEGQYATSIPLMHAMDVNNDVMLAFGQNGRVLHPDHGYPLRMIIPGYVGGRQVKWVHKLWVTKTPNTSHYHIWDNRVIPSFIESKDDPLATAFYHHEATACFEQILQSVICKPAHNETVPLSFKSDGTERVYNVQGFAYNGRGTRINRVELTLDGGKTWKYCLKRWLEKPLRYGEKHWAWVFWSCEVPLTELANAEEFAVRAADGSMQTQPENFMWNMMGMMNNSWYRLRPLIVQDPETKEAAVQFKHPVAPGNDDSGWMKPNPADADGDGGSGSGDDRVLSLEEIAKHDKRDDAWIIIDNKVYDVTSVIDWHPGGDAAILGYAGKATVDTTSQYKGIHDQYANGKRDECLIGVLSQEAVEEMEKDAKRAAEELAKVKEERKGFSLQPDSFTRATLVERKEVSYDTRLYKFALPKQDDGSHGLLRLPIGQHVLTSVHFEDHAVLRPYTPIAPVLPNEEDGTFTLCVKTYFPTDGGPYPPGGLISNYLDCMKGGEEIDVRGPMGEIIYKGHGDFTIQGKDYHFDKVNLVAGGTGLTPHWQLIHAMLKTDGDETLISMIDSNKTYEDILMREELLVYAEKYPERFKLWHALSKAPENIPDWPYPPGRLDQELMEKQFYPSEEGVVTLLCGPPGLIEKGAVPGLEKMGFEKGRNIFGF